MLVNIVSSSVNAMSSRILVIVITGAEECISSLYINHNLQLFNFDVFTDSKCFD